MQYGLKIVSDLLIAYSGFVLLFCGQQRNTFYVALSEYFPNQQEDQKIMQLTLMVFSILIMSFSLVEPIWMKILGIFAFLLYNILCFTGINKIQKDIITPFFLQNMVLLWIAIKEDTKSIIQNKQFEKNKQQIKSHHKTYKQTWYPIEYPVQKDDMETPEHQAKWIQQIVNLPSQQIIKLQHQIQQDIKQQQEQIQQYQKDQQIKKHEKDFNEIIKQQKIDAKDKKGDKSLQNGNADQNTVNKIKQQKCQQQQDQDFDPYYEYSKPQIVLMTNFANK